jgi:hypothetical protein
MSESAFPRLQEHAEEHARVEQELRALVRGMWKPESTIHTLPELLTLFGTTVTELLIRCDLDYRSHLLFRQGL